MASGRTGLVEACLNGSIERVCAVVDATPPDHQLYAAGKAAAIKAGYVLLRVGLSVHIINIPEGLDPDDWVKRDGNGPFLKAIETSEKILPFHFHNYSGDLSTTSGKSTFVSDVLVELAQIKDPVVRELHARTLSELIQISSKSISWYSMVFI